jgi:hypothetical protein
MLCVVYHTYAYTSNKVKLYRFGHYRYAVHFIITNVYVLIC